MSNSLDKFVETALCEFPSRLTEGGFLKALFRAYGEVDLTIPSEQDAEIRTQMNILKEFFPDAAHAGDAMKIPDSLNVQIKLIALKALPVIEQKAIAFAKETHRKMGGKRTAAVNYVMQQYSAIEANIPGLRDTIVDNDLLRQEAGHAVDWAWEQLGDLINTLGRHAPVNNDPALPTTLEE